MNEITRRTKFHECPKVPVSFPGRRLVASNCLSGLHLFLDLIHFLFFLNSTKKQSKEEAKVLRQELEEEREERHVVQQELERTTQRVAAMLDSMEGVEKEFHTRGDSLVQLETSLHTSTHAIYALQVNIRSFPCPFDGFLLFFESH